MFGDFIDEFSYSLTWYAVRRRLFSDPKMHDLEWMTLNGYCTLNSVFVPVCLAFDYATFENSYKNISADRGDNISSEVITVYCTKIHSLKFRIIAESKSKRKERIAVSGRLCTTFVCCRVIFLTFDWFVAVLKNMWARILGTASDP